jgi:hypothetical protein
LEQNLGRELYRRGWTQGVLFAPVAVSIAFDPAKALSKLARAAAKKGAVEIALPKGVAHGVASGIAASTERMVLVSQTCDIVRPLNEEPNVFAMPVFKTENTRILGPAARNSTRYFLLDASRGLIVDATTVAVIEKPLLEALTPEVGISTDDQRRRFGRWLARRFRRPALEDDLVAAIVKPILENLRALQAEGRLDMELLDQILEARIHMASSTLPYAFDLLFMVEVGDLQAMELRLAPLVGEMRSWFRPEAASLRTWYARCYADISVADYEASDQIYLDEYSYRGGSIRGLIAPEPG